MGLQGVWLIWSLAWREESLRLRAGNGVGLEIDWNQIRFEAVYACGLGIRLTGVCLMAGLACLGGLRLRAGDTVDLGLFDGLLCLARGFTPAGWKMVLLPTRFGSCA